MQSTKTVEIAVGIFVVLSFLAILMLSMKVSRLGEIFADKGYTVTLIFENIGGLTVKSPVKMAGVRIGRVANIFYDDEDYQAIVKINIDPRYKKIPIDTSASIYTAGLLGEQYIGLEPGAEEEYLTNNAEIDPGLTQSAIILEQLIGKYLYNSVANAE
ncbi:MAG: outer membrane lipid asymmetry maintenance protein MlaD [Thiomargarita sp.]|nr:outer membrane lipid asymmetry maintenance protein MlaD [Thiomargarita sp.]